MPVIFHNLRGYDSHFIIREVGQHSGKIKCIPNNQEEYISFSFDRIRFIDSIQFMASSLDSLVDNLYAKSTGSNKFIYTDKHFNSKYPNIPDAAESMKRKGVYPYEYVENLDILKQDHILQKSDFYSSLNDSCISNKDFVRYMQTWRKFGCKSLKE